MTIILSVIFRIHNINHFFFKAQDRKLSNFCLRGFSLRDSPRQREVWIRADKAINCIIKILPRVSLHLWRIAHQ